MNLLFYFPFFKQQAILMEKKILRATSGCESIQGLVLMADKVLLLEHLNIRFLALVLLLDFTVREWGYSKYLTRP